MNRPVITLLTDFGSSDHYVGAMKGVILSIRPDAQLVDVTHEIQPYKILDAAFTLSQSWPYFPAGSIHVVVVDPGVGSSRRALVAEAGGHLFVAPDNGVLTLVRQATGDFRAWEISAERFFRHPVSRTFHGRDIFAPVAAHLARGVAGAEMGTEVDDPVMLPIGEPVETGPEIWTGIVLRIDRFGNVVTNFAWDRFSWIARKSFEINAGEGSVRLYCADYSSCATGELFAIAGSSGYLEISANQTHAATLLGIASADPVRLRLFGSKLPQENA